MIGVVEPISKSVIHYFKQQQESSKTSKLCYQSQKKKMKKKKLVDYDPGCLQGGEKSKSKAAHSRAITCKSSKAESNRKPIDFHLNSKKKCSRFEFQHSKSPSSE